MIGNRKHTFKLLFSGDYNNKVLLSPDEYFVKAYINSIPKKVYKLQRKCKRLRVSCIGYSYFINSIH